jgi:hypothetical protein
VLFAEIELSRKQGSATEEKRLPLRTNRKSPGTYFLWFSHSVGMRQRRGFNARSAISRIAVRNAGPQVTPHNWSMFI